MANVTNAARDLDKALTAVNSAINAYFAAALAEGRAAGDPTERGLDDRQLRQKLQAYVVARLSPKATPLSRPVLQLDGAPEARRHAAAHPLPGLK